MRIQAVKDRARSLAMRARKSGRLRAKPCEQCGCDERLEMHHDDYTKPLKVRWLCYWCHKMHHILERVPSSPKGWYEAAMANAMRPGTWWNQRSGCRFTLHDLRSATIFCWKDGFRAAQAAYALMPGKRIPRLRFPGKPGRPSKPAKAGRGKR